jgi:hypothetical protein
MSSPKNKKKSFIENLWDFVSGANRSPTSLEVASALARGEFVRSKVRALYNEQIRIENRRIEIRKLQRKLAFYSPKSKQYEIISKELYRLFKQ